MAGLDRVADVVRSGVIPAGELWEVYIDRVGEGESPPFIGWCWRSSNWVVTCRPGVGFCKIGLALMAMACASPVIIFQGYLLRSLLAMSASFGCPG